LKLAINGRNKASQDFETFYRLASNDLEQASILFAKELFKEQLTTLNNAGKFPKEGSKSWKDRKYFLWQAACRDANLFSVKNQINTNLGYLYLVTNPAYPGWYKIGSAKDAETRLGQYQTASPHRDYVLEFYALVYGFRDAEKLLLDKMATSDTVISRNEWVMAERAVLKACLIELSRPKF